MWWKTAGRLTALATLVAGVLVGAACDDPAKNVPRAPESPGALPTSSAKAPSGLSVIPDDWGLKKAAPQRLVAIGDLHGDLERTKRVLRLAGAIDGSDNWAGGSLLVVQTGDQVDRGDDDRAILDLLERLRREARSAGGDLTATLGNHELMNVGLDFRYVTPGAAKAFEEFAKEAPSDTFRNPLVDFRGRAGAFAPGHAYARKLAEHPLLAWYGDSVFVHGGILPKHLGMGLATLSRETREWLNGERREAPKGVTNEDGVLWTRLYSAAPGPRECAMLDDVLGALGAKRMVVGHTVQAGGITSACDGKVQRIDCGMSSHYGGPIQALEIKGDDVKILKE